MLKLTAKPRGKFFSSLPCLQRFFSIRGSASQLVTLMKVPHVGGDIENKPAVLEFFEKHPIVKQLVESERGDHAVAKSFNGQHVKLLCRALDDVSGTPLQGTQDLKEDLETKVKGHTKRKYNSFAQLVERIASYVMLVASQDSEQVKADALAIFPNGINFACADGTSMRLQSGVSFLMRSLTYDMAYAACERLVVDHSLHDLVYEGNHIHIIPGLLRLFGVSKQELKHLDRNHDTVLSQFPPGLLARMTQDFQSMIQRSIQERFAGIGETLDKVHGAYKRYEAAKTNVLDGDLGPSELWSAFTVLEDSCNSEIKSLGGDRSVSDVLGVGEGRFDFEALADYVYGLVEATGLLVVDEDAVAGPPTLVTTKEYPSVKAVFDFVSTDFENGYKLVQELLKGDDSEKEIAMQALVLLGREARGNMPLVFMKVISSLVKSAMEDDELVDIGAARGFLIGLRRVADTPLCLALQAQVIGLIERHYQNLVWLDIVESNPHQTRHTSQELLSGLIDGGAPLSVIKSYMEPRNFKADRNRVVLPRMKALCFHPERDAILKEYLMHLDLIHDRTCLVERGWYTSANSLVYEAVKGGIKGDELIFIARNSGAEAFTKRDLRSSNALTEAAMRGNTDLINYAYGISTRDGQLSFFSRLYEFPAQVVQGRVQIRNWSFIEVLLTCSPCKVPQVFEENKDLYSLRFFDSELFTDAACEKALKKGGEAFLDYLRLKAPCRSSQDRKVYMERLCAKMVKVFPKLDSSTKLMVLDYYQKHFKLSKKYPMKPIMIVSLGLRPDVTYSPDVVEWLLDHKFPTRLLTDPIGSKTPFQFILESGDVKSLAILKKQGRLRSLVKTVPLTQVECNRKTMAWFIENNYSLKALGYARRSGKSPVLVSHASKLVCQSLRDGDVQSFRMFMKFFHLSSDQFLHYYGAVRREPAVETLFYGENSREWLIAFKDTGFSLAQVDECFRPAGGLEALFSANRDDFPVTGRVAFLTNYFEVYDVSLVDVLDQPNILITSELLKRLFMDCDEEVFRVFLNQFDQVRREYGDHVDMFSICPVIEIDHIQDVMLVAITRRERDSVNYALRLLRLGYTDEELGLPEGYWKRRVHSVIKRKEFDELIQIQEYARFDLDFYGRYLPLLLENSTPAVLRMLKGLGFDKKSFLKPIGGKSILELCVKPSAEPGEEAELDVDQLISMIRFYLETLEGDIMTLLMSLPKLFFDRLSTPDLNSLLLVLGRYKGRGKSAESIARSARLYQLFVQGKKSYSDVRVLLAMGYSLEDMGVDNYRQLMYLTRFKALDYVDLHSLSAQRLRHLIFFVLAFGTEAAVGQLNVAFECDPFLDGPDDIAKADALKQRLFADKGAEFIYSFLTLEGVKLLSLLKALTSDVQGLLRDSWPDLHAVDTVPEDLEEKFVHMFNSTVRMERLKECFGEEFITTMLSKKFTRIDRSCAAQEMTLRGRLGVRHPSLYLGGSMSAAAC